MISCFMCSCMCIFSRWKTICHVKQAAHFWSYLNIEWDLGGEKCNYTAWGGHKCFEPENILWQLKTRFRWFLTELSPHNLSVE